MNRATGLLLAFVLVAVAAVWLWQQRRAFAPASTPAPTASAPSLAEQHARAEQMVSRVEERRLADPTARTPIASNSPEAAITDVRVRVVDAATGSPVAGARVVDLHAAQVAATTDADGRARSPSALPGRVAFCAEGYLANLPEYGDDTATALTAAAERAAEAVIELVPDAFTLPCTLRFLDAQGQSLPETVRCALQCLDDPPPSAMSFPTARLAPGAPVDRAMRQAWERHVRAQALLREHADPLHFGVTSHERVFDAPGGQLTLHCIATGNYRVTACAPAAELAGERAIQLALGDATTFEVRLLPGRFVDGVVLDAQTQQPIAGASVALRHGTGLARSAVHTGADGRFRLGPLATAQGEASVLSPRHLELVATLQAGAPTRLLLTPRPVRAVHGVVRQRPGLQAIAGADVQVRSALGVDAAATTGADGSFALQTVLDAGELAVFAVGFLPWIERLDEPVATYACDLFPAAAAARVRAGLSTLLEGRVLDADGKPIAGAPVQLFTDEVVIPEGLAGRAVLEGHILPLSPLAVSGDGGAFVLEWFRAGSVRLVLTDAQGTALPLTLSLGQHVRDLVLRPAR